MARSTDLSTSTSDYLSAHLLTCNLPLHAMEQSQLLIESSNLIQIRPPHRGTRALLKGNSNLI